MHQDEVDTDPELVRRLLRAQFPPWASLPIEPVAHRGTDHAIYRSGDELAVRMPRISWAVQQVEKERRWLPRLAPHLPLRVPVPVAVGEPGEGYPWRWSVAPWLSGENALFAPFADEQEAARELAGFVRSLQAVDATGGPGAGDQTFDRGLPLASRDADVRGALSQATDMVDAGAVGKAWDAALESPVWDAPASWFHGDLFGGNLLLEGGRLTAVIDWGALGVGDPACDAMPAWTVFGAAGRRAFRDALEPDDATWARGRGWALSVAVIILPYYRHSNPTIVGEAMRTLDAVLSDPN
jgi:aminoglycoside phosphotransferase (APT) family kinase protein